MSRVLELPGMEYTCTGRCFICAELACCVAAHHLLIVRVETERYVLQELGTTCFVSSIAS